MGDEKRSPGFGALWSAAWQRLAPRFWTLMGLVVPPTLVAGIIQYLFLQPGTGGEVPQWGIGLLLPRF